MAKSQHRKDIVFTNTAPIKVSLEYSPKPATQFVPEWYRKMENYFPSDKPKKHDSTETIKKCIPVFDAMTSGYIIQTVCDIAIEIKDGEPNYIPSMRDPDLEIISGHSRKQAHLHPIANEFNFPKFKNFWSIKTPKGYSCLFIPPMHNPNPYFTALPGIVDTDTFQGCVNFPFILNNPTKNLIIPAGTPIVQVIPFKRDEWQSSYEQDRDINNIWFNKVISSFFGAYKNKYWTRKVFK